MYPVLLNFHNSFDQHFAESYINYKQERSYSMFETNFTFSNESKLHVPKLTVVPGRACYLCHQSAHFNKENKHLVRTAPKSISLRPVPGGIY